MPRISRATWLPPDRNSVMSNEPLKGLLDITFDMNTKGRTFFTTIRADTHDIPQQPLTLQSSGGLSYYPLYEFWVRVPQFAGHNTSGRFDDDPLPFQGRILTSGTVSDWRFGMSWTDPVSGAVVHSENYVEGNGLEGGPSQGKALLHIAGTLPSGHADDLLLVHLSANIRTPLGTPKARHFVAGIFWWEDSEEFTYPPLPDLSEPPTEYLTLGQYAGVVPAMWPQDPHERDDDALDLDEYDMTIQTP